MKTLNGLKFLCLTLLALTLFACTTSSGGSKDEKRAEVLKMRDQTLADLYKKEPHLKSSIKQEPGYAVFSNVGLQFIWVGGGGGYGVVTNNKTGQNTYMKMAQGNLGLGLGIKDFRAVFIFHNEKTLQQFTEQGWQFGGGVDAAAKSSEDKGGALGGAAYFDDNITAYQMTKSGILIQSSLMGTKYWKDPVLN